MHASKLRQVGVALVCAKVALLPVVFDYSLDVPFTVAKTLVSHGLAYVLVGVLVGLFVRFGRSFLMWSPLHVPVLAFLAASIAAAVFAADTFLALYGAHARMLGLGTIADWVGLYFAVVLLVRTRREVIAMIACIVASSVVVLSYELVQLVGMDPLSWNMDVTTRPISTIGQATSLAHYLTTLAVGIGGLALLLKGLPTAARPLLLVLACLLLAGAAATGTRSVLLGIAAGGALLVLATWLRYPSGNARLIGIAGLVATSAGLAVILLLSPVATRFSAVVGPQPGDADDDLLARLEPATETRAALYEIAAKIVRSRPVLGYGPDNFVVGVPQFLSPREPFEVRQSLATSAHSWLGYVATSSGLIGLAAFTAIAAVALVLAFRGGGTRPLALVAAAVLVAFLATGLTTINEISTEWLFWAAAGTIAAATTPPVSASNREPKVKRRSPRVTRADKRDGGSNTRAVAAAICVALGLALSLTAVNAWEASRSNRSSQQARLQGRAVNAIDLGLSATRLDSGRAEYWHGLGLAYVSAGRWADASAAFDRAAKLAPYDVRNLGDHARAQLLLAGSSAGAPLSRALELSEQAVRLDPNNPSAHLTRAVVMQVARDLTEALRSVDRALALDPKSINTSLYVTATQIYLDSGRPSDAVRIARAGVALVGSTLGSIPLRYELARALVATNQPLEALAELDVALSINAGYAPAQRLRTEIRATLQR
jgi:tetratricopeptide (TPR) repeat protein/O-antigen ligase